MLLWCYSRNILVGFIRTTTPWPVRYQLPILPPAVVRALESKDRCFLQYRRNSCRNQLIQCLYDDINKFTLYLSSTQFSDVLATICSKYPYLNDFPSRSGSSSQQYLLLPTLLESLKNKFKKERLPLINIETVAIHKRTFGNPGRGRKGAEDCLENEEACSRTHRDLPHSLPIGEDDLTVAKHHQDMLMEYRKLRPDMSMLIDRQKRSWFVRAKDFDGRFQQSI
ncbi:uncharacterized protein LOC124809088 [Hydra vulgaris]|uniref:uncharacterized protein LOC124809088 n=1 Tax=Hydra vulgaris TaxID=6087 RepID=UPI0032EA5E67